MTNVEKNLPMQASSGHFKMFGLVTNRYNSALDSLFGIVVSTSNCHPRGPGFDSRLYHRNFSGSIGSGTGSTQSHEDNWVAT